MFWENFVALCEKRGKKPNPIARELGVASGTVTEWKKGRIPQSVTLKKISDYFGVPVDALLDQSAGEPQEKPVPGISLTPGETALIEEYRCNPSFAAIVDAALSAVRPHTG